MVVANDRIRSGSLTTFATVELLVLVKVDVNGMPVINNLAICKVPMSPRAASRISIVHLPRAFMPSNTARLPSAFRLPRMELRLFNRRVDSSDNVV